MSLLGKGVDGEAISEDAVAHYQTERDESTKPKRAKQSFPRDLTMYLIQSYRLDSLKTISSYFSNIHYSTVSNGIAKAKRMIESDAKCCNDMEFAKQKPYICQR